MANINIEDLNTELQKLEERSEIIGTALVKRNGILITSRLPRDVDERKVGALAATIFGAIETVGMNLESKNITNITIELNNYKIITLDAIGFIFVFLTDVNVNLGLVLIEAELTINKVKEMIYEKK